MKHTLLYCGATIAFSVLSSLNGFAKPLPTAGNFSKPAAFTENKGQVTDQHHQPCTDIDFKLDGGNVTMFVGDGQIHYMWYSPLPASPQGGRGDISPSLGGVKGGLAPLPGRGGGEASYRMDVILLGANKNAELIKEGLQQDYENYYLPQCPDGVTARRYNKITYKNIYPNIDWEIASPNPSLGGEPIMQGCKYNFIVHPGGDYRNIKIQYNGATTIALKDGALIATTPMGSITEHVPYTYDAETKKEIKSNFILNNNILSYNISFPLGEGRDGAAFIIDPTINWGTYYADSNTQVGEATADTFGNMYMVGRTVCMTNIASVGSYQSVLAGDEDAFVVKFSALGSRLWGTYYGGAARDWFNAVTSDGNSIYASGYTSNAGLATSSAHQQTYGGGLHDALLVKFNNAGLRQWATYYGSTGDESFLGLACDIDGNVFAAGSTTSYTAIATTGAYQTARTATGGYGDGMLVKFNSSGVRQWGTYYGGNQGGAIEDICVDACGNVIMYGETFSNTGIASPGAYQTTQMFNTTVFFGKFSNSGVRQWASYYPISGTNTSSIGTDCAGNIYFTGNGDATPGITTTGTYKPVYSDSTDAVLIKFNPAGQRVWGTYYGGVGKEQAFGLCVNPGGNIYITGQTSSLSGIATTGAPQTAFGGGTGNGGSYWGDAYIAAFDTNGQRVWGSYYGGTGWDMGYLPTIDRNGKLYLTGLSYGHDGIATPGAFKTTYVGGGGSGTSFLASFNSNDTTVVLREPFTDTVHCQGDSMFVYYRTSYTFNTGNTFSIQLSNASGSFASPTAIGTATATGFVRCYIPLTTPAGQSYRIRLVSTSPARTLYLGGTECPVDIHIYTLPAKPNATSNAPICAGQTLSLNAGSSGSGFTYGWEGPNTFTSSLQNPSITNAQTNATGDYYITVTEPVHGCKGKDTVSITINTTPSKPNATGNSPICSGQTLNLFATTTTGGVSWSWAGPGGFNTSVQNPTIPNAQTANAGSYVVTATLGNCSSSDTEVVVINQGPAVNVYPSPNDTICQGGSVTLVAVPISAGTGPTFQWYKNSNPIGGATNTSYSTTPNNGDVYYCQMTPGTGTSCTGAVSSNSITMTVLPVTTPSVSISGPAGAQDPYNLLTFHATGTGGGSNPKYQWLRSGHQLIQGAIADTWSTQGLYLSQHDTICVILTSSDICAVPKSDTACMAVNILTGVEDINKNTTIQLYPNPNDGRFTIDAKGIGNKEVTIEIVNAVGQTVHQQKANTAKGILHETISTTNLSAGIYLLKLHDGEAVATLRLVISR